MTKAAQSRYALLLEYEGTHYAGFQIQKNARTIQGEIEQALSVIFKRPIRIAFAGRTDAGVHASAQVISFDLEDSRKGREARFRKNPLLLARSLNGLLHKDISVRNITRVKADFHPRYSCLAREYEYLIWNHPLRSGLWHNRALWLRQKIDLEHINQELASIIGLHDFSALTPQIRNYKDPRRQIYKAVFLRDGDAFASQSSQDPKGLLRFQICANAFLHNMIRVLLGTLLEINAGRLKNSLREIIAQKDRKQAGFTAPPEGLYLRQAYYPAGLELNTASDSGAQENCLALWTG